MKTAFAVVSSSGRIVIPLAMRHKLGIEAGTRIAIHSEGDRLVLQAVTAAFIRSLRGCCKGGSSLVEALEEEHRREK
ncbi:MAG TPA: AbrB/MazE/SpoVT family DNA-binding domain-containing protein [Terriglobales bacterium]|nr:AbrB/MazE/SpoVT family DNA-binding domain-containing protein [Terriglobales bacterium]